jgi:epoxyqueuosine reductase QueG
MMRRRSERHAAYAAGLGTFGLCDGLITSVGKAVRVEGRDKQQCRRHLHESCAPYVEQTWNLKGYGCGLCQTGVPCESEIPRRKKAVRMRNAP